LVTIKDIAKKAGVSTSTVSHCINDTSYVSPPLKRKIYKVIKELDYNPNLIAKSLKSKKTKIVGLILPEISDIQLSELAKVIEKLLNEKDYNIIIVNSEDNADKEFKIVNKLINGIIDGLLIIPAPNSKINYHKILLNKIPIICLDRKVNNCETITIMLDNFRGSYEAIKYLIDLGHKQIAYIGTNNQTSTRLNRLKGFMQAIRDGKIEIPNEFIIQAGNRFLINGHQSAQYLLSLKIRPTAIFAEDDIIAIGAMRGIVDSGFRIPEDISIIGFDDNLIDTFLIPRLSTVHYPIIEMAKTSVELLIQLMSDSNNIEKKNYDIVLVPELKIRESTAKIL